MLYALAFLAIIALIVIHEAGHFWVARLCSMKVERFSIFFGPAIAQIKTKATTYQIGVVPLGGFVQITGMNPMEDHDASDPYIYPNRPAYQRFLTILAGPFMNYAAAVVMIFGMFLKWGVPHPSDKQEIGQVLPNSPAQQGGLEPGDVLDTVNGEAVSIHHSVAEVMDRSGGKAVRIVVLREGQSKTFVITPRQDKDNHYRVGVALGQLEEFHPASVGEAARQSVVLPLLRSKEMLAGLADMIRGRQKPDVTGPIQITYQLGKQMRRGPRVAIDFIATLSILLGLFNLLPLPALDGGRLAFLVYEILTRRRVNQRIEARVHMVGVMVLLGVMVLVMFKDVRQLFTHGG
jgi:regulator of sigma E protease